MPFVVQGVIAKRIFKINRVLNEHIDNSGNKKCIFKINHVLDEHIDNSGNKKRIFKINRVLGELIDNPKKKLTPISPMAASITVWNLS
jgi:hypothetical protein